MQNSQTPVTVAILGERLTGQLTVLTVDANTLQIMLSIPIPQQATQPMDIAPLLGGTECMVSFSTRDIPRTAQPNYTDKSICGYH